MVKRSTLNIQNSPLHIHFISRWHFAPGLLKSHLAHVVSSTIAEGCGQNANH
jgi:hypothetical protein